MKIRVRGLATIVGAAALCFALPAFGQVSLVLNSYGGSYNGPNGSAIGGSYGGTLNGIAADMACDDYHDEVNGGQSYNMSEMNASQIPANLSSTLFGLGSNAAPPPPQITVGQYAEVAALEEVLLNLTPTSVNSTPQAEDLSGAVWYITGGGASGEGTYNAGLDSGALADINQVLTALSGGTITANSLNGGNVDAAIASITTAEGTAALDADTNLWLYTPSPDAHSAQEFWSLTNAPEGGPAFLYLLLAAAACFGAMRFKSRSQLAA